MNEHLEDALDFYLGENKVAVGGLSLSAERNWDATSIPTNSKPEAKIWRLIDQWKKQGLNPKFEICAKMLRLWGVEP